MGRAHTLVAQGCQKGIGARASGPYISLLHINARFGAVPAPTCQPLGRNRLEMQMGFDMNLFESSAAVTLRSAPLGISS